MELIRSGGCDFCLWVCPILFTANVSIITLVDGGGVRGLSELLILQEIMKQVQLLLNLEQIPLPADYFDMIGGTSTGGLRMPIDKAIDLFDTLSSTIFGKKQSRLKEGRYPHQVLEDCVKDVVANQHDGNRDAKLRQNEDEGCKRSYASPTIDDYDCAIWEAARATSAAPKYFKDIRIGLPGREETFFDGGIGCNNPIKELHSEARSVFNESRLVDCILSIGTGLRNAIQVDEPGFFEKISIGVDMTLISAFKKMALSSSEAAKEMERKYVGTGNLYVRLDVNEGLQRVKLDEWSKIGEIRGRTLEYLSLVTTQTKIHAVAQSLAGSKRSYTRESYSLGQLSASINEVIRATQGRSITNADDTTTSPTDTLQEWLRSPGSLVANSTEDLVFHLSKRFISEDNEYTSCSWIFETPQYQSFWTSEPASSLWIHGPPGCGKSVTTAAVIDQLLKNARSNPKIVVLYYFCDADSRTATPVTILRSFLAQVLRIGTQGDLRKAIYKLNQCRQKISVLRDTDIMAESTLWEILKEIISLYSSFPYIVVDGIEAVEFNTALIKFLISVAPRANILLTSRFSLKSMESV